MTNMLILLAVLLFGLIHSSCCSVHHVNNGLHVRSTSDPKDQAHMRRAVELALKSAGRTHPNPCVGCVLVNMDGEVVGEGWHEKAGEPHAEVMALRQAGRRAQGCTAYVTLEPCNHHGRTPPCTLALINHGIRRVVAGMVDPDSRVSGEGLKALQTAGIEVLLAEGEEHALCQQANAAFVHRILQGRPLVTALQGLTDACNQLKELDEESQSYYLNELVSVLAGPLQDMDSLLVTDLGDDDQLLACRLLPMVNVIILTAGMNKQDVNAVSRLLQAGRRVFMLSQAEVLRSVRVGTAATSAEAKLTSSGGWKTVPSQLVCNGVVCLSSSEGLFAGIQRSVQLAVMEKATHDETEDEETTPIAHLRKLVLPVSTASRIITLQGGKRLRLTATTSRP